MKPIPTTAILTFPVHSQGRGWATTGRTIGGCQRDEREVRLVVAQPRPWLWTGNVAFCGMGSGLELLIYKYKVGTGSNQKF